MPKHPKHPQFNPSESFSAGQESASDTERFNKALGGMIGTKHFGKVLTVLLAIGSGMVTDISIPHGERSIALTKPEYEEDQQRRDIRLEKIERGIEEQQNSLMQVKVSVARIEGKLDRRAEGRRESGN